MFCTKCGAQLEDGVKFCPSCGNKIESGGQISPVEEVKKSAQSIRESVNKATGGKSEELGQQAKQTADTFIADVKDATKTKDAKGFFKKNNYKNTKIIVVVVIVLLILSKIFGGGDSYSKTAEKYVETKYGSSLKITGVEKEVSGDDWVMYIVSGKDKEDGTRYKCVVTIEKEHDLVGVCKIYAEQHWDEMEQLIEATTINW